MKRLLFILTLTTLALSSSAQKYQDALLYGENKNRLDVFYLMGIPNDTFAIPSYPVDKRRHPHIAAKGNTIYLWDTTGYVWNQYAPGGGVGSGIESLGNTGILWLTRPNDSTYAVDSASMAAYMMRRKDSASASNLLGYLTLKTLNDSLSKFMQIDTAGKQNRYVLYYDSPTGKLKFKIDSTGADGKVDSVRFNATTNILTIYQDIAADQSVHLSASYLDIDSTYEPIAGKVNDSTWRIKSLRIQVNGSTLTPTVDGNKINWNVTGIAGNDSAYVHAYLTADSTALIMVRDNNGRDTFHFRVDTTGMGITSVNIYNSSGTITSDRTIDGAGNDVIFNDVGTFAIGADTVHLALNAGKLRISSLANGGDPNADSLLAVGSTGLVRKLNTGNFVKTSQSIVVDTTGATTGQIAYIDRTGADTIKFKADSVGTGGGSPENDSTFRIPFNYYDEFAPAVGDSVFIHSKMRNRWIEVWLNGQYIHQRDSFGYRRVGLSDTITFSTALAFDDGYRADIICRDTIRYQSVALEAPGAPGASWSDLTFTTTNGWFTETSHVWTSGAGAFGGYGLETGSFTGEVWVKQQRYNSSSALSILGFNESNTNEANAGYEFASYFDATGAITYLDNGSGTTIGYTLATGSWMALHRDASGTVTIETSADGLTGWTVRYTFTPTSTATFYINMNLHSATYNCHYPQVYY